MNSSPSDPLVFLESRRKNRLLLPIWVAVIGLTASLGFTWAAQKHLFGVLDSYRPLFVWSLGMVTTGILVWITFVWRRRSLSEVGRELDSRFNSKNRLETVAELSASYSPMALAQRDETAKLVEEKANPKQLSRIFLRLGLLMIVSLLTLHVCIVMSWGVGFLRRPAKPEVPQVLVEKLPIAEITWESPLSEMKATKIEEVPLSAIAESTTGLESLSLEVAVNGEPRKSIPISEASLASGRHPLKVPLYLDELEVEPYDVISYHLRAERKFHKKLPPTLSELQFIQIRPFREDVGMCDGSCNGEGLLNLLKKLKTVQLRLMKQNFLLAASELPRNQDPWDSENKLVANEQETLASKDQEALDFAVKQGAPPPIVDAMTEAASYMSSAAESMHTQQNNKAATVQGKALALITNCEKFFTKTIGSSSKPKAPDPFHDEQRFTLPPRPQKENELEMAEKMQAEVIADLNEAGEDSEKTAQQAKKQTDIRRKLTEAVRKMADIGSTPEEVETALQKAQEAAKQAETQLRACDSAAALEPATRALQQMRTAMAGLKQQAVGAFAEAQSQLNNAAAEAQKLSKDEGSNSAKNEKKEGKEKGKGGEQLDSTVTNDLAAAEKIQGEIVQGLDGENGTSEDAARYIEKQKEADHWLAEAERKTEADRSAFRETRVALQNARADAKQVESQLGEAKDAVAAREPAARVLQRIRAALGSLKREATLAHAQGNTKRSGDNEKSSSEKDGASGQDGRSSIGSLRAALIREALRQQEVGSSKAAENLAGMINELGEHPKGDPQAEEKRLRELALRAAAEQIALLSNAQAVAQVLAELRRVQANIESSKRSDEKKTGKQTKPSNSQQAALNAEIVQDLETAAQKAILLSQSSKAEEFSKQLLQAIQNARRGSSDGVGILLNPETMSEPLAGLIFLLEQGPPDSKRTEIISQLEMNEAPPAYRSSIARYFEQLSHETHPSVGPSPSP